VETNVLLATRNVEPALMATDAQPANLDSSMELNASNSVRTDPMVTLRATLANHATQPALLAQASKSANALPAMTDTS